MPQVYGFFSMLPIPYFYQVISLVLLIIGGTLLVISRRDLTTVEGIGLLLLVWAIPLLGLLAVMAYLWFVARRHRK